MSLTDRFNPAAQRMESSLVRELLHYAQQPDMLSLAGGLPDERHMPAFPEVSQVADSRQYGPSEGEGPLRAQIVELLAQRGLKISQPQVLITNGSQQGLDIVSRLLLDAQSVILTEEPTYLAAIQVFKLQGAQIVSVASDEQGMSIEALRAAIDTHQPKAVYLIPNFQNPAGHCYSRERREAIAQLLDEKNQLLIEDDPYRDLCYDPVDLTPITSLIQQAPWVYMGSFSKVLWPGLRTGYLASCEELRPYLVKIKQATDLHTNRLGQAMISQFLASGALPAHLQTLREVYREKRDIMAQALETHLGDLLQITVPKGGMFFWVQLPEGLSSRQVMEAALQRKLLVLPGTPFFAQPSEWDDRCLRLSFARVDRQDLQRAIQLLNQVIRSLLA